jgi:hypothetical protein
LHLKLDKLLAGPVLNLNELSYAIICLRANWSGFNLSAIEKTSLIARQFDNLQHRLECPQSEAVYVELVERFAPPRRTGYAVAVIHRNLLDPERAAAAAEAAHKAEINGRGRPPQEAFREFIWRLADAFENIGGIARVWQRHDLGELDSPFMRWVKQLCDYLPEGSKPEFEKRSVTEVRAKLGRQKKH